MSIIASFTALAPDSLHQLQENPDTIAPFLYPDDGAGAPPHHLDLGKAWHGLHYLLTGTAYEGAPPLALAIVGGEPFGPDVGYGPARFLTRDQVAQVAAALAVITKEELAERFDPEDMENQSIYPAIWASEGAEALVYVLNYFGDLQTAYADAAARGDAVILWMH